MDDNGPRALIAIADPGQPMHVGALLGNSPAMLRSMAAAAFGGYVPCGINTTRRGDGLAADIGKPLALVLATPEQPDDADNILRAAFGNEATERDIDEFARRFGCRVVDSFGSSEFAVVVMPRGRDTARFDRQGISGRQRVPRRDGDKMCACGFRRARCAGQRRRGRR
jgi:hypothetical protein